MLPHIISKQRDDNTGNPFTCSVTIVCMYSYTLFSVVTFSDLVIIEVNILFPVTQVDFFFSGKLRNKLLSLFVKEKLGRLLLSDVKIQQAFFLDIL